MIKSTLKERLKANNGFIFQNICSLIKRKSMKAASRKGQIYIFIWFNKDETFFPPVKLSSIKNYCVKSRLGWKSFVFLAATCYFRSVNLFRPQNNEIWFFPSEKFTSTKSFASLGDFQCGLLPRLNLRLRGNFSDIFFSPFTDWMLNKKTFFLSPRFLFFFFLLWL